MINDIVLAYGSLGKLDQGLAFYRRNSPEDLKRVTRTLGYLADERGDVRKAGRAWKMVVRKYPDTDEALESQRALIASLFASSRYNELWKEIRFLIQKFGPGSQWQKGKTEEVIQDFDKNTIEMARYYPKAVHRAAEKKKSAKLYDQAELGYLLFLERFASSKYAPEIFEYLGDIFYYKKQFGKAGKMYLGVVEMGPKKALMYPAKKGRPKSIHKRVSDYMLDAFERALNLSGTVIPKSSSLPAIKPLTEDARNLARACELYERWYPKQRKINKACAARVARVFYQFGQKDRAIREMIQIVSKYPGSKEANLAIESVIPLLKDDQVELVSFGRSVLKMPVYAGSKIANKIRNILKGIQIDLIANETSANRRANLYEKQAKSSPDDPKSAALWYRAGSEYLTSGEILKAVAAYKAIDRRYPNSQVHKEALLELTRLQKALFKIGEAAVSLERFHDMYPNDKSSSSAIKQACYLSMSSKPNRAINVCLKFFQKEGPRSLQLIERLLLLLSYEKTSSAAAEVVRRIYDVGRGITAEARLLAYCRLSYSYGVRPPSNLTQKILNLAQSANLKQETARCVSQAYLSEAEPIWRRLIEKRLSGGSLGPFREASRKC